MKYLGIHIAISRLGMVLIFTLISTTAVVGVAESEKGMKVFEIGVVRPKLQTTGGENVTDFDLISESVEEALIEVNKKAQAKGLKIEIRDFLHDKEDIAVVPAVKNALASKVIALVGASPSPYALLAAKELKGTELVLLPPLAAANELIEEFPQVLMMSNPAETGSVVTTRLLKEKLRTKKFLAVIEWDRTATRDSWEGVPQEIKEKGDLLKVFEANLNIKKFIKKLKTDNYDAVFCSKFPIVTAQLIRAAATNGIKIPL